MAGLEIVATVDRIETRADSLAAFAADVVLRDATGADGTPLPNGIRVGYTGKLRALDLMPGARVALGAWHLDAYAGRGRIGANLTDVAGFLGTVPPAERGAVTFRLVRPAHARRVCAGA